MDNRNEFLKAFDNLINNLAKAVDMIVKDVGEKAVQVARDTGEFKNTLKEKTHFVMSGQYVGEVMDDRSYAGYLEYGNDPGGGRIYPINAKALHFFVNGEEVFAKSVRAHGPYHFIENGRDAAENELTNIFAKHIQNLL
jgi:hypothetical protein